MAEVEGYALAWHPNNGAKFRIKREGVAWSPWVATDSAGLAAFAAIMNEAPVYASNDGWLSTGPEPLEEEA